MCPEGKLKLRLHNTSHCLIEVDNNGSLTVKWGLGLGC